MADVNNPFGFLSDEQIRAQGWTGREEFDRAAARYLETFGLDDAMSLPSEFFTKSAVENTLRKKPEPVVIPGAPATTPPETTAFAPAVPPRMFEPRPQDETQERLREAARGFVAREEEKALAEGQALTAGERAAISDYTAQEVQRQRSITGAPSYSVLAEMAKAVGLDTVFPQVVQSLEPQPIMSDKQIEEYDQALKAKQTQAEVAFSNYYDQNAKEFEGVLEKNVFMGRARDQLEEFKYYSDLPGSFYGPDVVGPYLLRQELTGNGWSPEYKEAYERSFVTGDRPKNPEAGLLSVADESGRLVESSLGATLRGLVLGEALVGVAGEQIGAGLASVVRGEGLTANKSFQEAVADRVAKGEGLEKTATNIAESFGAEKGSFADDAAWWLGLGAGFFLPLDLGVTEAVGAAISKATTPARVAEFLGETGVISKLPDSVENLKTIIATGGDAEAAIKKGLAEGIDIRTVAVDNATLIPEVRNVAKVITTVDRKALSAARSVDDLEQVIKEATDFLQIPYEGFVRVAKSLGLDELMPAGKKSSLPISDNPKAWLNFIDDLSIRAGANTGRLADKTELLSREIVKGRLDKAVAEGKLPAPEMVMITPTVALSKDQVAPFLKRLREEPVMEALVKASNQPGDKIILSAEDIRLIRETAGGRQVELPGMDPALREELQQINVRTAMVGTELASRVEKTKPIPIERSTLNTIIDRVVGKFAAQEGTGLTLGQMSTIAKETQKVKGVLPSVQKFNAALTRVRLSEAFTPVATRPTGFIKLFNEVVRPTLDAYTRVRLGKFVLSPEEAFAKNNIISALAGIPDGYKVTYDSYLLEAKRQGLKGEAAHDYAFAETMANPFDKEGIDNLFPNFMSAYYGGYDSAIELDVLRVGTNVSSLRGKEDLMRLFQEAQDLAGKAPQVGEPVIVQVARLFKDAQTPTDKVKVLTLAAKLMEGRPLSSFVDSPIWPSSTKSLVERIKDMKPQFSQANIKVPMFATYIQQERANRVFQNAYNVRATDAITNKATFQTAIANVSEALGKDIKATLDGMYDITDPNFAGTLTEFLTETARMGIVDHLSTRNFPLTTPNTRYVRTAYQDIMRLVNERITNGDAVKKALPAGVDQTTAELTLAKNIFTNLGFTLQINKTDPASTLEALGKGRVRLVKDTSANFADGVADLIVGTYSPALTQDQMRSWVYALVQSNKMFASSAKARKLQAAGVAAETALNGLYGVDDMKKVIKSSSSLRSVEEAFTAFDWLRDNRIFDGLTEAQKLDIAETLGARTTDFTQKLSEAINSIAVKETPVEQAKLVLAQTGYAGSTFLGETLPSFVKQSILGGAILPNVIYHFQNYITAPMIIAVNSNRAGRGGKRFILEFLSDYNIFSKRTITTPTGKVYTYKDIEDLSSNLGLASSSQQKAEIDKNLLRDLINYAGSIGPGGALGSFEMRKNIFKNMASQVGIGGYSIWSQFSNNIDMAFRRKSVARALEEGRTEAEAVAEARKIMFDYNDLTEVERNVIAKYIWFYRFMRQNLVQTTVAFLDEPGKIARLAKLSKIQSAKMFDRATGGNGELHPDLAQYKDNRSFVALIDGMDKERLAIYTPPLPILDATAQLVNLGAFVGVLSTDIDALAGLAEPMDPVSREKIIEQFLDDYSLSGPAVEAIKIGLARSLGIQVTGFEKEPIIYLDPRFVAMAKASGMYDTLMAMFDIEVELNAADPRAGITTFDGYYYRLGKSESNRTRWQLFTNIVQTAGISRIIRDYAILLPYLDVVPGMEAGTEITTKDPVLDALKALGVFNISAQPTEEAVQRNVRYELIRSLQERSK